MNKRLKNMFILLVLIVFCVGLSPQASQTQAARPKTEVTAEAKIIQAMHLISSHTLLEYVKELTSEKYGGRLTGTKEYDACAEWVADLFSKFGLKPGGENGTYFQLFPNPYTVVLPGCELSMHIPVSSKTSKEVVKKYYQYEDEFIPGGTSGSGEVTAEVVYVGYGVTAPELGYDDYRGVDVKDKIVLMEREVPVSPDDNRELFMKWRPYSFHQYKLENAVAHGARGMIYNYGPIVNPNNSYRENFIYSHVGEAVVQDVFAGTGRKHSEVIAAIKKKFQPQSFYTGKIFTLKNKTEHYPQGQGKNVIAILEGTDPVLKNEYILIGGHLDHVGRCPKLMPGANDNASAVAVTLGVAEAMARCALKPKRSVMFILFGAEEQAVAGSDFYVNKNPLVPLDRTICYINMEGPGSGDKISVLAGENFPGLLKFLVDANEKYIHRQLTASKFANLGRPRQDVTWFLWKGVPGVTVGSYGFDPGRPAYHNSWDNLDLITPEIMEDIAQLLFVALVKMGLENELNFRN